MAQKIVNDYLNPIEPESEDAKAILKKRGGARPGSGRKRRMDEQEIIAKLEPMAPVFFKALFEKLQRKDARAIDLFAKYYLGEPLKRVETKIEGQLNQVQVEVVRPELVPVEELVN